MFCFLHPARLLRRLCYPRFLSPRRSLSSHFVRRSHRCRRSLRCLGGLSLASLLLSRRLLLRLSCSCHRRRRRFLRYPRRLLLRLGCGRRLRRHPQRRLFLRLCCSGRRFRRRLGLSLGLHRGLRLRRRSNSRLCRRRRLLLGSSRLCRVSLRSLCRRDDRRLRRRLTQAPEAALEGLICSGCCFGRQGGLGRRRCHCHGPGSHSR